MALCLHLAFWTGGDAARMDRLFRRSGSMRAKWDEVHYADGATYGERTIERALETVDEVYEPDRNSEDRSPVPLLSETSGESGSHPEEPASAANRGRESVYLEERNRLLQQKVRSQTATIERQANRIDELENEIDAIREELAAVKQPEAGESKKSTLMGRLTPWFMEM